jgi:hypothetical protein
VAHKPAAAHTWYDYGQNLPTRLPNTIRLRQILERIYFRHTSSNFPPFSVSWTLPFDFSNGLWTYWSLTVRSPWLNYKSWSVFLLRLSNGFSKKSAVFPHNCGYPVRILQLCIKVGCSIPLLGVCSYPKVQIVDENWVFPSLFLLIQIIRSIQSHGRNPAEFLLYQRTSTTGNCISWSKIWRNRAINEPMVTTDHWWHESSQVLVHRQRLQLLDKKRYCQRLNHQSTIQDFGTRDQGYTEMLYILVTLSTRVTGVTTPRLNKAAGNTGMDHRYHNTSIDPWCTKHNQSCITTRSNTLNSIAIT